MTNWNKNTLWHTMALAIVPLSFVPSQVASAQGGDDKAARTPCFWQRDPLADFEGEGSNYCAPSSIADGLVYLAKARGLEDLVDDTDHEGQIELVTELAEAMKTDPTDGTNPDKILTGLKSYVKERGYSFKRLEVATWRALGGSNKTLSVGVKPDMDWLTEAVGDPNTIVICNFGWYKKAADGTYTRHSGHWVNAVATGEGKLQFDVHNPYLEPKRQKKDTAITLSPVANSFVYTWPGGKGLKMAGYYQAQGPGLPFSKQSVSAAVLDAVIVFKIAEE